MIVVIDNYDSFTYNLVQYLGELGAQLTIVRNDEVTVDDLRRSNPKGIVISPGPCTPSQAGISVEVVRQLHTEIPILGVCLGHQAIGEALGGRVVKAPTVMHGKTSSIEHEGSGIFRGIESPFLATRYHSLIVERDSLPDSLRVIASTSDGIIMGMQHRKHPTFGVQFHPESIATQHGKRLLRNFLTLTKR
jgi:anthranilate synthase component 2